MYNINVATKTMDNFKAGPFPIATDYGEKAAGATIRARAPLSMDTGGKLSETTAATLANVVGISAAEPSGDEVVYCLTGEYFTQALVLPNGVTAEALKPALRKLSIFLRERSRLDGDPGTENNDNGGTD